MLATALACFEGVCESSGELNDGGFEVALCSSEILEADVSDAIPHEQQAHAE
jgi:hypothetical protein